MDSTPRQERIILDILRRPDSSAYRANCMPADWREIDLISETNRKRSADMGAIAARSTIVM
jgi:hypothetical protein